ncbi:MAG: CHAT domain-containing protein [Saprospiraceae bacterium]|nr:CHAT domain-containing protein [Saprospiraceae bacterium]
MKNSIIIIVLCWTNFALAQELIDSATLKQLDSLLNVSKNLREKGDLIKSFELDSLVSKQALEKLGRNSAVYANSCISRGKWNLAKSNHAAAETFYFEAIHIFETLYGTEHNLYAKALNNLGVLYYLMGKFEPCESIYLKVRDIQEKAVGKNHIDFAVSLNNLALLYKELGRYDKAEPYYTESYLLFKKILGVNHPQYAKSVTNLGVFYFIIGAYDKAEPLYLESKEIREKSLGKKHQDYGVSLTNLGTLYAAMGNLDKTERYYIEATQIFEQVVGKNHPKYAQSLYNLASLYNDLHRDSQALVLLLEAKAILFTELGTKHPDYVNCIHLLAHAYKTLNNYELAESYHREALEIQKSITGKEHTAYANSLISLAKIFMETSRDSLAELFLTEAQTIFKRVIGSDYAEYATVLGYLAIVNEKRSNVELADNLLYEYMVLSQEKLIKSVLYLSPEELNKYADRIARNLATLLSINYRRNMMGNHSANLNKAIFNTALFQKGFVLNAANRLNLLAAETSESNELNTTLQSYKRRLAKEYAKLYSEQNKQLLIELEEKANIVEKDLVKKVNGYSDASTQVQWNDVKLKLQPGDAVLEFVNFKLDFPKKTDSIIYAVLLLRFEDSIPVFIPLFEEQQLSLILQGHSAGKQAEIYASRGVSPIRVQDYTSLYNLVWKPIEMYLINSKKIYLATSGNLHRLNFTAIAISNTTVLGDKYKFTQIGSTRQLVQSQKKSWNQTPAALIGGINYNISEPNTTSKLQVESKELEFASSKTNVANKSSQWSFLPGTDQEISSIFSLFKNNNIPATQFRDRFATESEFKAMGKGNQSPRVLHIATHGYFFPDSKSNRQQSEFSSQSENVFKISNQPMLRSGLILAGGNSAWQGDQIIDGKEDGILSAYEISQMNLSNTELVVLSACETGLGDIQGNEGVYGLQRAFKIAGAKYLIMSLWQVPDKQTSLLMTAFYKKWLENKMTIPDAFHAAQKELRDLGLDPYQWAGFVLVE